jgi:hypothetical protein
MPFQRSEPILINILVSKNYLDVSHPKRGMKRWLPPNERPDALARHCLEDTTRDGTTPPSSRLVAPAVKERGKWGPRPMVANIVSLLKLGKLWYYS